MDANQIFDAFESFSDQLAKRQKERDEYNMAFRRSVPLCGSCDHWAKSRECPKEHNVKGISRGPSMNGMPCEKFKGTSDFLADVEIFRTLQARKKP
jgi:hypothetical protein